MTHRILCRVAALCLLVILAGCEEEKPVTIANLAGSWEAKFDDTTATITFAKANDFTLIPTSTDDGGSGGLYFLSGWGKLPMAGTYRLDDKDITLQVDGFTSGGMTVDSLKGDVLTLTLEGKAPIEWTRVKGAATPAPTNAPPAAPAGNGPEDGEAGDEASGDGDLEDAAADE